MYDSRPDTMDHIGKVQGLLKDALANLALRASIHDQSKLESPEKETFDEFTPKLADTTYGSEEYRSYLVAMKPALDHHYANNRHHPEWHQDGIKGMTLLDLTEMLCDWAAAVKRHSNGSLDRSIEFNQTRFGYSDELKGILINTAKELRLF